MARLLALLLVLGAGCTDRKAPVAAPPAARSSLPAFDFAAYGDCRSDQEVHRKICARIVETRAKVVLVSGDLVDYGEDPEDWRIFREVTGELRGKASYWAAPGNHDVSQGRWFEKEFGLERTWFDRRSGDLHVFLLDSNWYFREPEQLRWLEETAGASDALHKIAVFHHPPWSIGGYSEFESRKIRETMHPLLVRLRFCAAFCGHHHAFYTTRREGIRYVVTAGGGAPLYSIDEELAQEGDQFRKFHHFVACRIMEKGIEARVYDPDGVEDPALAFALCEHR
jgi:hypothetical protein